MGIDYGRVVSAAVVVCVALVCLTVMAVKGLVPASGVMSAATGAIGLFTGWLVKQPTKETSQ